jgi:hypothetical protein
MLKSNPVGIGQDEATFLVASITAGIFGLGKRLLGLTSHYVPSILRSRMNSKCGQCVVVCGLMVCSGKRHKRHKRQATSWPVFFLVPTGPPCLHSNLNFEFEF